MLLSLGLLFWHFFGGRALLKDLLGAYVFAF